MTNEVTRDIIEWDIKSWSRALEYWERNIEWDTVENVLELGGRRGGLSLWTALKGKKTVCSDLGDTQLSASELHSRYEISEHITYQDIDATDNPYENHFDIIVFKSIIGGVGHGGNREAQQKAFHEIYKALKPGGKLLFAENLVASPLHQCLRRRYAAWGARWRYVSIDEMREFLSDFSTVEMKFTGITGVFGRNERQKNMFATLDGLLLNHVCPDRWKYIAYGIAVK